MLNYFIVMKANFFFIENVLEVLKFKLYNKAEILEFENIDSDVIQRTSFNSTKLVVIVHGYQGL